MITLQDLREFAPAGSPTMLVAIVEHWHFATEAGIETPLRISHFMAQLYVESAGFRSSEENLRYSAKRLMAVWPKRFPALAAAERYAFNPEALANQVYGGRMGNTERGDGWKYRGRGPKQITGRDNYRLIGGILGLDLEDDPDLLLRPDIGFKAAVAYWQLAECNRHADRNDIRAVTRAINGGYNGLADRRAAFRKAAAIWGEDQVAEIGGKGPVASNIGRASLLGGGLTLAGAGSQAYEIAQVVESGRSVSEAFGVPLITLALFLAVLGLLAFIYHDRLFQARWEGL